MAIHWRADDDLLLVIFWSSLPSSPTAPPPLPEKSVVNVEFDPHLQDFLDPRRRKNTYAILHLFNLNLP